MRTFAVLACILALACGAAAAAPPKKAVSLAEPAMQVHVVRSAHPGCEPRCLQWIAAQGKIVAGTAKQFRKVLSQLGARKLPVFIDSSGGSVNDALAIGRLIRAKGLDVAVTRTVFTPCAPADAACRKAKTGGELRGVAQAHLSKCASSCAFVLAGGIQRFVGAGTGVGVHQISMTLRRYMIWTRRSFGVPVEIKKTLVSEQTVGQQHAQTRRTYANIGQHLSDMGIGEDIMSLMMSTPNHGIRWLTQKELRSTRLATHFVNGEELVTGVPASMPAPTPSTLTTVPTVHELMRYEPICEQIGTCQEGASSTDLKLELPGYLPKAPSAAPPSAEAPKAEHKEDGAQ